MIARRRARARIDLTLLSVRSTPNRRGARFQQTCSALYVVSRVSMGASDQRAGGTVDMSPSVGMHTPALRIGAAGACLQSLFAVLFLGPHENDWSRHRLRRVQLAPARAVFQK